MFNLFKKKVKTEDIVDDMSQEALYINIQAKLVDYLNKECNFYKDVVFSEKGRDFVESIYGESSPWDKLSQKRNLFQDFSLCFKLGNDPNGKNLFDELSDEEKKQVIVQELRDMVFRSFVSNWKNEYCNGYIWLNYIDIYTNENNAPKYKKELIKIFSDCFDEAIDIADELFEKKNDEFKVFESLILQGLIFKTVDASIVNHLFAKTTFTSINDRVNALNTKFFVPQCALNPEFLFYGDGSDGPKLRAFPYSNWILGLELLGGNPDLPDWYLQRETENGTIKEFDEKMVDYMQAFDKFSDKKAAFHKSLKKEMLEMGHPLAKNLTFDKYGY